MTIAQDQLLSELASHSATCTLSLPSEPLSLLRRSRVLRSDERGVWVAADPADFVVLQNLISEGLPVHVTVRLDEQDILFHSLPIDLDPGFVSGDGRSTPALKLCLPERISTSQRRKTFRVALSEADGVSVRLWRINEYVLLRDRVLPSQELPCKPKDLGEGGLGATVFPLNHEALGLKSNQRFRVELRCGRHEMVFEARLRFPESTERDDASANCGFEFIYNDRDVESRRHRQKLQVVMSEIQRNAVRREQLAHQPI